jgi:hypothetical protein
MGCRDDDPRRDLQACLLSLVAVAALSLLMLLAAAWLLATFHP